jgi:hypothetical protein
MEIPYTNNFIDSELDQLLRRCGGVLLLGCRFVRFCVRGDCQRFLMIATAVSGRRRRSVLQPDSDTRVLPIQLLLLTAVTAVNHCSHNQRALTDWAY